MKTTINFNLFGSRLNKATGLFFLTGCCILAWCIACHGQDETPLSFVKIDSAVSQCMVKNSILGLSVGMVRNGQVSMARGYGWTDDHMEHKVNAQTAFNTASVTKLFTATAVMQLVEEGSLVLDGKVTTYLPEFRMKDQRYKDITIEHLLTHSSGLPWDFFMTDSPDDTTALGALIHQMDELKLKFDPGEKIIKRTTYSNIGYDLLGYIVERVSGVEYTRYISEKILSPAGMTGSTFYVEQMRDAMLARPYELKGSSKTVRNLNTYGRDHKQKPILNGKPNALVQVVKYADDTEHNPNGNLISSANDLALWGKVILDIYHERPGRGTSILSKSSLDAMWKINRTMPTSLPGGGMSICLGWWSFVHPQYGHIVYHVGKNPGFCSILMVLPEEDFSLVILCNGGYALRDIYNQLPYAIMEAVSIMD